MKCEDLFEAIGGVDDLLLEENVAPAHRRHWLPLFGSAAACFVVVVTAAGLLRNATPPEARESIQYTDFTDETAAQMSESHWMGLPASEPEPAPAVEQGTSVPASPETSAPEFSEPSEATALPTTVQTASESMPAVITTAFTDATKETLSEPADDTSSFRYVLTQIYEKRSYMGVSFETAVSDIGENRFAIYDVDGDGKEELVFLWESTDTASMRSMIYGHDADGNIICEFQGNALFQIYSNGLIRYEDSREQEESFSYTLCRYDTASDTYENACSVRKSDSFVSAEPAPPSMNPEPEEDEANTDGSNSATNSVYYVGEDVLDAEAFRAWETETFGNAYELHLPFQNFTWEEIAAVLQ